MILIYNLIEYSSNYSKTSGSLWQYFRDESAINNDSNTVNFLGNCSSFKFKQKITGKIPADGNTNDDEKAVPLKYLSNFWRTLEMSFINCEINVILTWSADCVIFSATGETKFAITDAKLYVTVVTLSTQNNAATILL